MIKINLLKEEKKGGGLTLPSFKEFKAEDIIKEGAVKALMVISGIVILGEIGYIVFLKKTVGELERERNILAQERNQWKAKAQKFMSERRSLESEIAKIKARIDYLEKSKKVIITMKKYYNPFNSSIEYIYTKTPATVWLSSFVQNQSFSDIRVSINFSAYDINTIDRYFVIINDRFSTPLIRNIERKLNKHGITYYVSSIVTSKGLNPESLGSE